MLPKDNHNGIIKNIFNVDPCVAFSRAIRFKSRKYAEKVLLNIKYIFLCGAEVQISVFLNEDSLNLMKYLSVILSILE